MLCDKAPKALVFLHSIISKLIKLTTNFLRIVIGMCFTSIISVQLLAQTIKVVDINSNPLMGVEIYNRDLSVAAVTDKNGEASLNLERVDSLSFNYLGFKKQTIDKSDLHKRNFLIQLRVTESLINEIVILGRREVFQYEIPYSIRSIKAAEISSMQAQTSADALSQHGDLYVQKSQMGGGSPVIRGFEANRVLLVVDGVRLNNAIYRAGHLQNAITVDHAMLESLELIYGSNSLHYGSDAFGGVVHFKTQNPDFRLEGETKLKGEAFTRYSSANSEKSANLKLSFLGKSVSSIFNVTRSSFGNQRFGSNTDNRYPDFGKRPTYQNFENGKDVELINSDPFRQVGTKYSQWDFMHKLRFKLSDQKELITNFQYSTSSDVPRYDNLTEKRNGQLRWGEWFYGPQKRILSAITYKDFKGTKFYDKWISILAYQKIDEDRISRLFNNPWRNTQQEDVDVISLTFDWQKYLEDDHLWVLDYGLDFQYNHVSSSSSDLNILTNESKELNPSRYASEFNSLMYSGAFISITNKSESDLWVHSGGVRFTHSNYHLKYEDSNLVQWPTEYLAGVNGRNSAINWSVGTNYNSPSAWHFRAVSSTAFRSPNIDDLSKIRVNSSEITFPNLELKPERIWSSEIGLTKNWNSKFQLGISSYYTLLYDAIVRNKFDAPGIGSIWMLNGENLTVVANQNISKARILGFSMNLMLVPVKNIVFNYSFNYTKGRDITSSEHTALAHIPPIYGSAKLRYKKDRVSFSLRWNYNAVKKIEDFGGMEDNPELATPVGSLSWNTFNVYSDYTLNDALTASLGLENIFDIAYRPFSSGLHAPGRNLILSLKAKF